MCKRCGTPSPCPPPCPPPVQYIPQEPHRYEEQACQQPQHTYAQQHQHKSSRHPQEYGQQGYQQNTRSRICDILGSKRSKCPPARVQPAPILKQCPPRKQPKPSPSDSPSDCMGLCPLPPCPVPPNPPKPCPPPVCKPPEECFTLPPTQPCTSCCLVKPCSSDPCDHCPPRCSNPCDVPCLPPCPPKEICSPAQRCYFARNCCCGAYMSKYISGTTPDTVILDTIDGMRDVMGYLEECADDPNYYKNCLFQDPCSDDKERERLMKECRKRVECAPICVSTNNKCRPPY